MGFTISPQLLRDVRNARKLTQDKLARKARIGRRQIQRIETSEDQNVAVHEKTLIDLAKSLLVEPGVLTGDEPWPEGLPMVPRSKLLNEKHSGVSRPEEYQARLIKLDDGYAIVEFTKSSSIGDIIARDIPNEAAGRRLTSYHSIRNSLRTGWQMFMEMEADDDIWTEAITFIGELEDELNGPEFKAASNAVEIADGLADNAVPENALVGGKVDQ